MQKNLSFDTYEEIIVTNETLRGVLLQFKPIKDVAGVPTVCDIADLNKVDIEIVLKRANGNREIVIFNGYLDDLLLGLYAQNTKLQLNRKPTTEGYLMFLDLTPSVIALRGKDELLIKFKAQKTAFTGTTVSLSSISFQTMPAVGGTSTVPQVKALPIGSGEINFDKELGDGIVKITLATDYSTDYLSSNKAKAVSGDIRANGFEKPFTDAQLLAENMHYFDNNPDSDVEDLVAYWGAPMNKVRLRFKLDKAADESAKVLTLGMVQA